MLALDGVGVKLGVDVAAGVNVGVMLAVGEAVWLGTAVGMVGVMLGVSLGKIITVGDGRGGRELPQILGIGIHPTRTKAMTKAKRRFIPPGPSPYRFVRAFWQIHPMGAV